MWITGWRTQFYWRMTRWIFGFYFDPWWQVTICLGPFAVEIFKVEAHI